LLATCQPNPQNNLQATTADYHIAPRGRWNCPPRVFFYIVEGVLIFKSSGIFQIEKIRTSRVKTVAILLNMPSFFFHMAWHG